MRVLALICALLFSAGAALADPAGRYDVEGTNPGSGTRYTGTVAVEKTGDTYRVVWDVGRARFIGTAIGDDKFLAVTYRSGDSTGLALFGHEGNGVWKGANGREVSSERWSPR